MINPTCKCEKPNVHYDSTCLNCKLGLRELPLAVSMLRQQALGQLCVQEHLDKAKAETLQSVHVAAWRQPRGTETAMRDLIRGWARLGDDHAPILDNEDFARYYMAQGLAIKAMVEVLPTGRLSRSRLKLLVVAIGDSAGIDWQELGAFDDPSTETPEQETPKT